jgi:hypothetical protein
MVCGKASTSQAQLAKAGSDGKSYGSEGRARKKKKEK